MRIGAWFPQTVIGPDVDELVAFVRGVEDAGCDHLLVSDHVLGADSTSRPGWTGVYDHRDPFLEPLMLFAFLARECSLEFVTSVLVLPQRQTALVAKQVATFECLVPGRLRLGVGIGWNAVEYEALGAGFSTRGVRMNEQIPLLRKLWSEPIVTHAGTHETVDRAGILPLPRRRPPIWVAGSTEPRALARVGHLADGWLPSADIQPGQQLETAWQTILETAKSYGRAGDAIGLEGQLEAHAGNLSTLADRVTQWRDSGADAVALKTPKAGARWPDEHLTLLRQAIEHIAP